MIKTEIYNSIYVASKYITIEIERKDLNKNQNQICFCFCTSAYSCSEPTR